MVTHGVASLPCGIAMRGGHGLCEPWADRKPGKGARSGLRISHFGTSGCSHLWTCGRLKVQCVGYRD
jgi:hypothetical protein